MSRSLRPARPARQPPPGRGRPARVQHHELGTSAVLAVAPAEAGQDRELLLELRLTDERSPSPTPVEVPLGCELDEGLPDGGEADAPPLRQPLFRREPRAGRRRSATISWRTRSWICRCNGTNEPLCTLGTVIQLSPPRFFASGLTTERRCRHLLRLPTFDPLASPVANSCLQIIISLSTPPGSYRCGQAWSHPLT